MTFSNDQKPVDQNVQPDDNQNPLDALVGEGKKFKTVEDLAKGKQESDQYISKLESQLKEQDYAKQLLEQLKPTEEPKTEEGKEKTVSSESNNNQLTTDVVKELIQSTLQETQQATTISQNLVTVDKQLEALYGTEADNKVKERAAQVGMSFDQMKEMAGNTPAAFFALMGEAPKPESNPVVNQGSIDMNINQSQSMNFAYFQKMKREDPTRWYSRENQMLMAKEAEKQGSDFYK